MIIKQGTNHDLPKELFLYFKLADNNEAVYPISALRRVSCTNSVQLHFLFDTANFIPTSTNTTTDFVDLAITEYTGVEIMKAFAAEVNGNFSKYKHKAPNYIMVADAVSGTYLHADITGVNSITRAA